MLQAIFYTRFHPERGPDVLHQWPLGSITRRPADFADTITPDSTTSQDDEGGGGGHAPQEPLIPFSDISSYIIPPHDLCNRSLSICTNGYRILGFPVSLEDEVVYERNRFVCNVCFVLREEEDQTVWEGVVAKMAGFVRGLELEEGRFVSYEEKDLDSGVKRREEGTVVGRLLREVYAQMGRFRECCVRVNEVQVLNMKLERRGAEPLGGGKPAKVAAWDVPLLVRELPSSETWTMDLVLERILPQIDGVNHVKRIAARADVDLKLVKRAVAVLVQLGMVMTVDWFHFQAVYVLTSDFAWFVKDLDMLDKCTAYVAVDPRESVFADVEGMQDRIQELQGSKPTTSTVIELYSGLRPGISVADLCLANQDRILNIDIRRLITFGVIKGFLTRQHKYALALDPSCLPPSSTQQKPAIATTPTPADVDKAWRKAAMSSGWATPPAEVMPEMLKVEQVEGVEVRLTRWLNGRCCVDRMCVELGMSEKEILGLVRGGGFGEVVTFCR